MKEYFLLDSEHQYMRLHTPLDERQILLREVFGAALNTMPRGLWYYSPVAHIKFSHGGKWAIEICSDDLVEL